jgi:hypothetical protein
MLAILACPAIAQTGPAVPPQLWQAKLPEQVVSVALAPNAACVAVRTRSRAHVFDSKGNQSWETPEILSSAYEPGVLAVSPQCDWVAVFRPAEDPESFALQIVRRNGASTSVPLAAAIDVNGPHVNTLEISPDGQLLAVGFRTGYLWIVSREGVVRTRVGPGEGATNAGVTARFSADGKHVVRTGWFDTGLMNPDGTWVWKHDSRELRASRKLDLFAALRAPMHGPQYGEIAILDSSGKTMWNGSGYDASMAVAPDGTFVAFVSKTESADQPTQPPFPLVPGLNETPEIWIRDRNGKVLAHGPFAGRLIDVAGASNCILAVEDRFGRGPSSGVVPLWFAGFDSSLKEVWRIDGTRYPQVVAADLMIDFQGDTIRAYHIPDCNH